MAERESRAIRFVRAQVDLEGEHCKAIVELQSRGAAAHSAAAQGGLEELDRLHAVARATSDALSEAFGDKNAKVFVRHVQVVEGLVHPVVVVHLSATKGAHRQSLVGICDGASDLAKATALAVLNATNRFLGRD